MSVRWKTRTRAERTARGASKAARLARRPVTYAEAVALQDAWAWATGLVFPTDVRYGALYPVTVVMRAVGFDVEADACEAAVARHGPLKFGGIMHRA